MKCEYIPRGYSSWYEYNKAKAQRSKWLDRIQAVATVIILVGVHCVCSYIETL